MMPFCPINEILTGNLGEPVYACITDYFHHFLPTGSKASSVNLEERDEQY